MRFQVNKKITIVTFSATLPITVIMLDGIAFFDSRILKIGAMALVVFLFGSALLCAAAYSPKEKERKKSVKDQNSENGTLGVLIPVEDESDLGELIEVSEDLENTEPIITTDREEKANQIRTAETIGRDNEVLEELESAEEPVEELESLED